MVRLLAWLNKWRTRAGHVPTISCGIALQEQQLVAVQVSQPPGQKPRLVDVATLSAYEGLNANLLKQLSQSLDLSNSALHLVLGAHQYRHQIVELPNVPAEELKQALGWRLADLFADHQSQQAPSVSDFTFDVLALPSAQFGKSASQAFVFGLPNSVLNPLQMAFHEASLPLGVVDVAALSQRNLSTGVSPEGSGQAVLSFHESGGLLTVTQGADLYLVRHLETSLAQLMQSDDVGRQQLLERVALDVQRSFDVFDRQYHSVNVSKLLLAPMPPMPGVLQSLQQNLFVAVDWFDLSAQFTLPEGVHPWLLWNALGAALRPLEEVA